MPSTTFENIQVTDKNLGAKDAIFDATVVANYGDPGLDEDYHADILSRFVICKLESSNRTLTSDRYKNMLVVVRRPESLWIEYQGGFINEPQNQQRRDANLNSNSGPAANYTSNAIPRMNAPYQLGEKIKIKLIKDTTPHFLRADNEFFNSECGLWDVSSQYYQSWHTQGLNSNPYIGQSNGESNLRLKTIIPNGAVGTQQYSFSLNKIQYEAFSLTLFPDAATSLIALFSNSASFGYFYQGNGGYAYKSQFSLPLNFVKYEDLNIGQKSRTSITNCIPMIVTSPTTFTVPKSRTSGTVNYSPTYIQQA